MDKLTKELKFLAGAYQCEVPPVCTNYWEGYDWIKWIDGHGKWL